MSDFEVRQHFHQMLSQWEIETPPHSGSPARSFEPRLWVFWKQGFDAAPPLVRACLQQLQAVTPRDRLIELTAKNIDDFIDIPGYIYDKLRENPTHFSDVLRVTLLSAHGGVWADATCFITRNPLSDFADLASSGFFAFSRNENDQFMMSNWFLAATPGQHIPLVMREVLMEYWRRRNQPDHYFMFHYLFEARYNQDATFRSQWDQATRRSAYDPHVLQAKLQEPHDPAEYNRVINLCPVHKLTYKISNCPDGSYYSHIIGK